MESVALPQKQRPSLTLKIQSAATLFSILQPHSLAVFPSKHIKTEELNKKVMHIIFTTEEQNKKLIFATATCGCYFHLSDFEFTNLEKK